MLFTVGYEKRQIHEFISLLEDSEVQVLVDVRMNAISRKKGFSKTALRNACEDAGIEYCHVRSLGNPPDIRRRTSTPEECLSEYSKYMENRWDEALPELTEVLANRGGVALMCFEREHCECHRSVVADQLHQRSGLVASHL